MARRLSRRSAPRRKRVWAYLEHSFTSITSGTAQGVNMLTDFLSDLGANSVPGITIARIRGTASFIGSQNQTLSQLRAGIVVSGVNPATGNAILPYGSHADFMWVHEYMWGQTSKEVAASSFQLERFTEEIDVQSQRRMEEIEDALWFVVDFLSAGTARLDLALSILLLLP